jgi:hypothetical protein
MEPSGLIQDIESRQDFLMMQRYADIYVKHKKHILALMEKAVGEPLPPGITNAEAIELYVGLLQHPQFIEQVDQLVAPYNNAFDPVTAISESIGKVAESIGGMVGRRQEMKLLEQQADIQEQQFFQELVMLKQRNSDTGKILAVSGIAIAAVGITIYLIVKSRK